MPEVASKPDQHSEAGKSTHSLGVVVKDDKKQREFEQAVSDWANGKIAYEVVLSKHPQNKRMTFVEILLDILLGRK